MIFALTVSAIFGGSALLVGLWHFAVWAVHLPVCK